MSKMSDYLSSMLPSSADYKAWSNEVQPLLPENQRLNDNQGWASLIADAIAKGAGETAVTGAHLLYDLTGEKQAGWDNPTLDAIETWGKDVSERNTRNYTPGTARYYTSMGVQSLPEMALDTGIGIGAGALAGMAGGGAGSAAGAVIGGIGKLGKWGQRFYDAYNGSSKLARGARALTPSNQTLFATVAQTPVEAAFEGQREMDDYIEDAKRNGTYQEGVTENEARNLRGRVFRDNMGLLGITNAIENHLTFGAGKGLTSLLKGLGKSAVIEGLEEGAQQIIPKYERGQEWHLNDQDVIESALVGGAMGGIMHGAGRGAKAMFPKYLDPNYNPMTDIKATLERDEQVPIAPDQPDFTTADPTEVASWLDEQMEEQQSALPNINTQAQQIDDVSNAPQGNADVSDLPMQDIEDKGLAHTNSALKAKYRQLFDWAKRNFGKELVVSGGWRSPENNAANNGATKSHHLDGDAIDVDYSMFSPEEQQAIMQKAQEMGFNSDGDGMHDNHGGNGDHMHLTYEGGNDSGDNAPSDNGSFTKSSGNQQYDTWIKESASKHGVPANLLSSLLDVESGYNPNAKSEAGAVGIAQFMPSTAEGMGIDPTNPQEAIEGAARYLEEKYAKYGNWHQALEAYNGGDGNVGISETKAYADKVLSGAGDISSTSNSKADTNTIPADKFSSIYANGLIKFAGSEDDGVQSAYQSIMDSLSDEQKMPLADMFNDDGTFKNTSENRRALALNEQTAEMIKQLAQENAPALVPNMSKAMGSDGRISKENVKKLLTPRVAGINTHFLSEAIANNKLQPKEQKAVLDMAQDMVDVPKANLSEEGNLRRMNELQDAVDKQDFTKIYELLPNETAKAISMVNNLPQGTQTVDLRALQAQKAQEVQQKQAPAQEQTENVVSNPGLPPIAEEQTQQYQPQTIGQQLAGIASSDLAQAVNIANQRNMPITASAIMQSAINGQPIDGNVLDRTMQQDLNNNQQQANIDRQAIDARMQKAGLAINPATPNAGIIVPNGVPAGTPDIVIPDTPKRKAPTVNTNDPMARLNDSPVFRQAKANGDIGAMANEADAMGFHKESEQIRNSQYGNVPSKFDYKKRLIEVKKMSRADRIELGKELLNELEAKNIPVNDNLRNGLEHGVPKAIVNAEKKLANAETNDEAEQEVKPAEEATQFIAKNEPAENVTKQEVKAEKSAKEDTVLKGVSGIYESDIKDYIDRGYNIESYRGHLENGKPVYNLDFETSKDKARFVKDFYGESEEIDTDTSEPDYAKELDEEQEKKAGAEPAEEGNKKATNEDGKRSEEQNIHDGLKAMEAKKRYHEAKEKQFTERFNTPAPKNRPTTPEAQKEGMNLEYNFLQQVKKVRRAYDEEQISYQEAQEKLNAIEKTATNTDFPVEDTYTSSNGEEKEYTRKSGVLEEIKHEKEFLENEHRRRHPEIEEKEKQNRIKQENNKYHGFLDNVSPRIRGSIIKTLSKKFLYKDGYMSRKEYAEKIASKPDSSSQFKEYADGKKEYRLFTGDDDAFLPVLKTEYDYFNHLKKQQEVKAEKPATELQEQKPSNSKAKKIVAKTGKSATVITDSGKEINVTYKLVPAERLITSHNEVGFTNEDYPQELQPRDRSRLSMRDQISNMSRNLRPADLAEGRNLNQGAPIVRSDGVVLNGNGRTIAIKTAQKNGYESAKEYKKYLVQHAKELGFKASQVGLMKNPVLVRMVDDVDADTMQDIIGSTAGGSRMGASEQAEVDAKKITLQDLESYVPNDKGDLTTAYNQDFLRELIGKFTNKNDINAYLDKDGNINADGIQRVKRALFQAAYGDDELISKMAESTDDNVRNMTVALTNSAPIVARLNAKMDKELAHKYDLANTIAEAVKRLDSLRKQGKKVSDYLNEQSMFSEYEDTPEVKTVLQALDENKRSAKKISSFINRMVEIAEAQGNPNEESLFGDVKPYKLQDIINVAKGEMTNGREAELFQDTETSKGTERAGTEGNETVTEGNGGEVSSEHTQWTETVQSEPVVKDDKPKEKKKHRIFSTQEEAEKELEKALGIRPVKKKAEEKPAKAESKDESDGNKPKDIDPKKFAGVDISEEAETKLVAELKQALKKSRNRLNSLPVFDPDILAPAFKLGRLYVARGAKGFTEFAKTMIDTLGDDIRGWLHPVWSMLESADGKVDESQMIPAFNYVGSVMEKNPKISFEDIRNEFAEKYGEDNAKNFEPLLKLGFIGADNVINNPKEVTDSELYDSTNKPAERNSAGNNQDAVGSVHEDGESRTGRGQSVQSSGKEVRSQRSSSVHGRSTDTSGKTGNSRVQSEETKQSAGNDSTGAEHLSRSIRDSFDRPPVDDGRSAESIKSAENRPVNESSKRGAINGAKVDKKNFKTGSKKQIEASMPFLMKGQVDDVVKADNRLFSTDKNGKPYKGMMFTNGTGTGKTFTGLGVIKRFVQRGKKNILIIAPQDKTQNDWINAGKGFFGLDISKLKSTKDKGEGIVITSYQNVGENNALLERDWDLIVTDESHKLMQGEQANNTNALNKVRAMTYHNRGFNDYYEAKNYDNVMQERSLNSRAGAPDFTASDRQELADLHVKNERIRHKLKAEYEAIQAEDAKGANDRHKVLFLSATPFAYIKNIEYAEGYLFDYPAKEKHGYYNDTDGQEQFMIDHFGYRMRNNKLNKPDAEVNQDIMEIKFNEWLKSIGAVSSRKLEVKPDYERGYILVDGGVGKQIDRGLDILHGNDEKGDRDKYSLIAKMVDEKLKNNGRRYLLEAVKAKAAIPIIKEYLKAGKQVVVFHDFKKNEATNPFMLISDDFAEIDPSDQAKAHKQYEDFCAENPELLKLDMKDLMSPIERFQSELGKTVGIFNGDVKKSLRQDSVDKFNDDEDDLRVLLCQRASAKEGISLHDRTGKHQRVLIDLGLATRPTDLIQCEGRIYRTGVVTNAIIRYLNTGMNFERRAFADTIAGRSLTAENLSMGNDARNLRDAIVNGFMESIDGDTWKRYLPNSKTEGTGGKARDGKAMNGVSQFDEAVSDYFTNAKKNSSNKSREGTDYFPTPEPIGFKMVEWLGLKDGNKALEPSAGHGAISRYFSATTRNTIIEPSEQLATLAKMRLKGGTTSRVETTTFEQFAKANKFDGIAMNPPYGKGGKTAMEHLAKAFEHLYDGGRVIAIVPDGPAFNKRFDEWYGSNEAKHAIVMKTIRLPQCTFKRAGTSVATKILVIDKYLTDEDMKQAQGGNEVDLRGIENIKGLFSRIKNMTMPERIGADIKNHFTNTVNKKSINNSYMALVDDVKLMNDNRLYAIAFDYQGRRNVKFGGYGFATESLRNKFERTANKYLAEKANNPNAKVPTTESKPAENTESEQHFTLGTHEDTRPNVDKLYSTARPTEYLGNKYRSISNLAKEHNGHYSKYANNSFIFENENDRNEFVKEANALLAESNYSISPADNVKEQISEQAKAQAMWRLRTEIAEALPTAKNIRDDGSSLYFTMLNKAEVEIQIADELTIDNGDADKARKAHGLEAGVKIKVNGKEYTIGSKAVIQLALNGDEGSVYHEVFHAVWDMVLTNKEKAAIIKAYKEDARKAGKDVIEYAADRYRDWFLARNKGVTKDPSGNSFKFGKLWKKLREMVDKLRSIIAKTEEVNRIFKDIESGKVWERELDNALKVTDNDIKQMKQELAGKLKPDMTDDELDQAFLGTRIVRDIRANFNINVNHNNAKAYEYSRRFNRLGEEFERYVYDNRQRNTHNRTVKNGRPFATSDKRQSNSTNSGIKGQSTAGDKAGIRGLNAYNQQSERNVNYEIPSVLYLNNVKAIHNYEYDNNKFSVRRSDKDGFSNARYSLSESEKAGTVESFKKATKKLLKVKTESNVTDKYSEKQEKKKETPDGKLPKSFIVQSMHHLAKSSEHIKRIYNLATKAMEEQEKLRNGFKKSIDKVYRLTKDSKGREALNQILWAGDAEGKDYSRRELHDAGYSDNVIEAYKTVRDTLADAYNKINDARMQVMTRNANVASSSLEKFMKEHFLKDTDIISKQSTENGKILVTYKGCKVYENQKDTVDKVMLDQLKADDNVYIKSADEVTPGVYEVTYNERPKAMGHRNGYMPHFFHNFMVYAIAKDADGKALKDEYGNDLKVAIGSAESLAEATKMANKAAQANKDTEFVIDTHGFNYGDETNNNVVVGDREYQRMITNLAHHTEMTRAEANKYLHESAGVSLKSRHRFFGNMMKRKGSEGYEKEFGWALTHYLNSSARYVAMEKFKPRAINFYERYFGDFNGDPDKIQNKNKRLVANRIKRFISDFNGNPSTVEEVANDIVRSIPVIGDKLNDVYNGRPALALSSKLSWANATMKLGCLNIASPMLNYMQLVNIVTALDSNKYPAMAMKKVFSPHGFTELDKKILEESGVMNNINMSSDAGGYTQNRRYDKIKENKLYKWLITPALFEKCDLQMRQVAVLGAYYQGIEKKGMKIPNGKEISPEAIEYAKEINREANFDYSAANTPELIRRGSVLTQQMFQFQKYPIMQFEFFWDNVVHGTNSQRIRFLVPYMLATGIAGCIPFGELLNALLSTLFGAFLDDDDLAKKAKAEMMKWAGKDPFLQGVVTTVTSGLLPAVTGIDISSRAGMHNFFSGEYYGNKPDSSAGAIAQSLTGATVSSIGNMFGQLFNGNKIEAIKALSPGIGNIIQGLMGETHTTHHRVASVYNTWYEQILHGLGFRHINESNTQFINSYLYEQSKNDKEHRKDLMDKALDNPTSENMDNLKVNGITDKQLKNYKKSRDKSSMERALGDETKKPKKKKTPEQQEEDRLRDFLR